MSNLTTFDANDDNENLFLQAQKSLQESQLSLFKIVKKIDKDNKIRDEKVESMEETIKYLDEDDREEIRQFLNQCWEEEVIPE